MEMKRIPLMIFPLSAAKTIGSRYRGVGVKILPFYPSVRYDLRNISFSDSPESYCAIAFFSAAVWALVVGFMVAIVMTRLEMLALPLRIALPLFAFLLVFLFFLVTHLAYPKLLARDIAAKIDRELIFAMRDMLIQMSSGVPLFNAIENIGNTNYEYVSQEFRLTATRVKAGASLLDEIEDMAVRTQSVYLKKTAWQLATSIRAGANLTETLKGIVKTLVDYQFSISKSFNAQLNFIILIYLMLSAVLPTIGTTVLVIFSVFGMLGITPEVFAGIVGISFMGQMGIIAFVKSKRPNLFE